MGLPGCGRGSSRGLAVLLIDGEQVALPVRPAAARRFGLSVVHQDLGLIDSFSVMENMRVGLYQVGRISRRIRWRQERELARSALADLGADIDPDARVGELSVAERAEVAIARALQHHEPGRGVVMFDEATRALAPDIRRHFHSLVGDIVSRGGSVLLVSHQLEEVLEHTDRVTVLRDGQVVAAGVPTRDLSEHDLIHLMLGRDLKRGPRPARLASGSGSPLVKVESVSGHRAVGVNLSIRAGESVGLTGLLGSGFEELPYLLGGARQAAAGALSIGDRRISLTKQCTRELLSAGVALVPERRDAQGLAFSESVRDNVTLPRVRARSRRGVLGRSWQSEEAARVIGELGVRPADPRMPVGHLSGGNQQKVLLGKWLCGQPRLLLLHEPTQGVDVGARADIEQAIGRAADAGTAVLLASMDAGELAGLCDRVIVMRDGRPHGEISGEITPERIIEAVYGNGHGRSS